MSRIGQYKHIPVNISLNLETIAERLVETNYGVHNMLSAIVVAYGRKHPNRLGPNGELHQGVAGYKHDIVARIEKRLEAGDF